MAKSNNALTANDLKIIKHAVAARNFNADPVDENVLGRGSFGAVVRATLEETGRVYAIKVMPYTSETERVKYQKRELELLVKLKCSDSNVISYIDHWPKTDEGTQIYKCIQMELCFKSLADWMLTNPFCQENPRFYKHVFPQILNGLDAIHNIGWVHRDIHLGNLLIANPAPKKIQDIVMKVADFGLARKISTESSVPTLSSPKELDEISPKVGNRHYRAPEMSTRKYDYKVDLYSAGIVLYIMTCTKSPVEENWDKELTELRNKKRGEDHLFHQDKMLVDMLFERLLQESPEKRPSAAEALGRFSTAEVDGANPASSKAGINFLVKKENEDYWNRCTSREDSLSGFEEAVRDLYNIKHGNLSLCQDLLDNGEKLRVNVNSNADVKKMLRSAEEKNHKVRLIIPVGTSSGNKIPEGNFAYDAMDET